MLKSFRLCSNPIFVEPEVNLNADPVFTCDPMDFDEINRQAIKFLIENYEGLVDIYVNGSAAYLAELVRTAALFMAEEHLEGGRGVCVMRAWYYDYDEQCWKKQLLL